MLYDQKIWVGTSADGAVCLLPKMANRPRQLCVNLCWSDS